MNDLLVEHETETWHDVRDNLESLQSALDRWVSREGYTVAERTYSGFKARGVLLALEYWHIVSEDMTSTVSLREQLSRMILADCESGGYNPAMREGLRMSARLVCAVYGQ